MLFDEKILIEVLDYGLMTTEVNDDEGLNSVDATMSEESDSVPTVSPQKPPPVQRTTSVLASDGAEYVKRSQQIDAILSENSPISVALNDPNYVRRKLPVDPACDPEHPYKLSFTEIANAQHKLKNGVKLTECHKSEPMSKKYGMNIYFKREFQQVSGSFKERGARFALRMLNKDQHKRGVVAASAGNHALALSYHGLQLGIPVTVVMPCTAPLMKITQSRSYQANVIVQGQDMAEAKEIAMNLAEEQHKVYINGYDHPHVLAGAGTIGLEILEQVRDVDYILVPVGGGGLISGISVAVKQLSPDVKIIGVEADSCASFARAIQEGKPYYTSPHNTLADGLSVPKVGCNAYHSAHDLIDEMVSVSEQHIAIAILRLIEIEKCVVEGAGAVGLAAVIANKLPQLKGKNVVIPLCGGNIDTTVLGRCIERGLVADGRLVRLKMTVSDRPGGLAEMTHLLASLGVSIKDTYHERAWITTDIFSVQVRLVVETRDRDHIDELETALKKMYKDAYIYKQDLFDGF